MTKKGNLELVNLRKKLNLTQTEFSERLEIPVSSIRNWEQGVSTPPKYVINMIHKLVEKQINDNN